LHAWGLTRTLIGTFVACSIHGRQTQCTQVYCLYPPPPWPWL